MPGTHAAGDLIRLDGLWRPGDYDQAQIVLPFSGQHGQAVPLSVYMYDDGFRGRDFCGAIVICPARCRASIRPRQIMSRGWPFGWPQFQARHNSADNRRPRKPGWAAISSRMNAAWASVTVRPRYFRIAFMARNVARPLPEPTSRDEISSNVHARLWKGQWRGTAW